MDFETTRWTLVNNAAGDASTLRREALQELLARYMPALRAHLIRRKRLPADLADEILQGFLLKNILEGELIHRADRAAGRFRAWLLRWLDNYVRHELSRTRREVVVEEVYDQHDSIGADTFEIEWARATLREALDRMKSECEASGNATRWQVFEHRLVAPLLTDAEPTDYTILAKRLQLDSNAQVQNILVTAKRHFERCLESVIGRYTESREEITAEIAELRRVLAMAKCVESDRDTTVQSMPSLTGLRMTETARPDQVVKFLDLDCPQVWQRCLRTSVGELLDSQFDEDCSFGELLALPRPPRELLVRMKQFGNLQIQKQAGEIPSEVGLAIYLASIAAAFVRLQERISQSPSQVLTHGFQWLLEAGWLDEATTELIVQAKAAVSH
ncbi:MAG: sigma-70 family RNA polymerase sigma factor [Planctomycetales bacterium]|nr:sigma-70 family RNA polymerase sigma factor [Planctomycetales bacterium]